MQLKTKLQKAERYQKKHNQNFAPWEY